MTINRYRYFYACAFSMFEKHLVAFVDEMVEHDHAESTVKIYLSCVNDVAKAMHAAGIAASDLDEARAIELVAAMGWIKSRETYARFIMKRFVRFLAERGAARDRPATGQSKFGAPASPKKRSCDRRLSLSGSVQVTSEMPGT
jgi:integrase/recombinase XerD